MTLASLVVLVLLVFASLSAAHPSGAGLYGTGYPQHDDWFHPADQNPESSELCHSLRRHMDVLLRSKSFRCERLPGDAPDDVQNFCTSSGLPTISKCLAENEENGDAAQCLLNAQEDIAVARSTPLSWCFCQSLFESFLSVFSTSQLLCTENLLNDEDRVSRLYGSLDASITQTITNALGPDKVFSSSLNIPSYTKPPMGSYTKPPPLTYTKSGVTKKSSTTASTTTTA